MVRIRRASLRIPAAPAAQHCAIRPAQGRFVRAAPSPHPERSPPKPRGGDRADHRDRPAVGGRDGALARSRRLPPRRSVGRRPVGRPNTLLPEAVSHPTGERHAGVPRCREPDLRDGARRRCHAARRRDLGRAGRGPSPVRRGRSSGLLRSCSRHCATRPDSYRRCWKQESPRPHPRSSRATARTSHFLRSRRTSRSCRAWTRAEPPEGHAGSPTLAAVTTSCEASSRGDAP